MVILDLMFSMVHIDAMDDWIDDDQSDPDPFATFHEWSSEEDECAYADL